MKFFMPVFFMAFSLKMAAQKPADTTVNVNGKVYNLTEVVLRSGMNVPKFIEQVKNDTSFYKAFRNLRVLNFSAINDIRMLKKNGESQATLSSKSRQIRKNNCRFMITDEEAITGNMYDENKNFNYYTAQMYASLFFTKDSVCGEDNIVAGREFSTAGKSGMEKHKEQLKMLFFNPGKKINGIPFISNKTDIFEPDMAARYDMNIDREDYNKADCIVFRIKAKEAESGVVIDEMTTWFDNKTMEVVARNYSLSYDAGVYDFKVQMEVQMTRFDGLTVPSLIRYNGNWKAIFKKRERGVFTATLYDFKR